eukprot:1386445-Amorphochlora_amoeboformis.AAC.1
MSDSKETPPGSLAPSRSSPHSSPGRSSSSFQRAGDTPVSRRGEETEPEGEDLFDDNNIERDYRVIPELDRYDEKMLDKGEYDEMETDDRRKAERLLNKRDRERAQREGRVPRAFDDDEEEPRPKRRRRIQRDDEEGLEDIEEVDTSPSTTIVASHYCQLLS